MKHESGTLGVREGSVKAAGLPRILRPCRRIRRFDRLPPRGGALAVRGPGPWRGGGGFYPGPARLWPGPGRTAAAMAGRADPGAIPFPYRAAPHQPRPSCPRDTRRTRRPRRRGTPTRTARGRQGGSEDPVSCPVSATSWIRAAPSWFRSRCSSWRGSSPGSPCRWLQRTPTSPSATPATWRADTGWSTTPAPRCSVSPPRRGPCGRRSAARWPRTRCRGPGPPRCWPTR